MDGDPSALMNEVQGSLYCTKRGRSHAALVDDVGNPPPPRANDQRDETRCQNVAFTHVGISGKYKPHARKERGASANYAKRNLVHGQEWGSCFSSIEFRFNFIVYQACKMVEIRMTQMP